MMGLGATASAGGRRLAKRLTPSLSSSAPPMTELSSVEVMVPPVIESVSDRSTLSRRRPLLSGSARSRSCDRSRSHACQLVAPRTLRRAAGSVVISCVGALTMTGVSGAATAAWAQRSEQ